MTALSTAVTASAASASRTGVAPLREESWSAPGYQRRSAAFRYFKFGKAQN